MKKKKEDQKVHKDLKGFDIKVNPFGELKSNRNIDDINAFLNKHVPDKRVENEIDKRLENDYFQEEE